MHNIIKASIISLFFSFSCFADAAQTKEIDPATGIITWKTKSQGVNISLTQILSDQARAFYVNRGFSLKQAESFASSCIYMTVIRNENAAGKIHFRKSNWSVISNNKPHPLVSTDSWIKTLKKEKVNKQALIAFRWAQFPTEQEYEVGGDWNQGMLSIGLQPGSLLDVIVRWDIKGKEYEKKLT